MNCPLCTTQLESKVDAFYYACSTCFALVKDAQFYISNEDEKIRYESHNNDVADVRYQNFTSPITNKILEHCKHADLGLDYGCGHGPVITKMLQERKYQVHLYDPYFYPSLEYLKYSYDYIFSCEVFEHFSNPNAEIKKLISLLKPNGLLLIMTHLYDETILFENWYYRNDPTHVFIYTHKTMEYIADQFELEIIELNKRFTFLKKRDCINAIPFHD